MSSLREVFQRSSKSDDCESKLPLKVIELGTGCGVVGISLAQMLPSCDVLLTDLPEVEDLVSRNVALARLAQGSALNFQTLDWDDNLEEGISRSSYDVIVVSDCTYNSDSLPALVRVLEKLVSTSSPRAVVLVALKRRHESETVFFDLMEKRGFQIYDREVVLLPSLVPTAEDGVERVEMYAFRWNDER